MSFQSDASAPAWSARAAIAATGLVVLLAFLSGGTQGIGTSERDYWFSPADQPAVQSTLPTLDTPYTWPWSPSSMAGRAAMAIARGRRTALRDLAAVASAAAVVLLGLWLTSSGVPLYPVLIAMVGMAAGPTMWGRGIYWTVDALSPALGLFAIWAGWRWSITRRSIFAVAAGLSAALAIVETVVLPRLAPVAVNVRMLKASTLAADLSREFTLLGVILLLIGLAVLWSQAPARRTLVVLVTGLLAWQWFVPHSGFEPVSLPITICGWAAVAVALQWVQQTLTPRAGRTLIVVMGLLIIGEPALIRARMWSLGKDAKSEEEARIAYGFKVSDLPAGAGMIAESRRVDASLLLSSQKAGKPALIVPQAIEPVQAALGRGASLFAFAGARANLAPLGFLFERSWAGTTEVAALAGRAACIDLKPDEWVDVSLLMTNGSFILHGAGFTAAPGGVVLRLTDAQPVRFATIEPRSIPFELGVVPHEGLGIPELDLAAARSGVGPVTALRIRETGRRDPVRFTFAAPPQVAVATADGPSPVTMCPGLSRADLTIGRSPEASAALQMTSASPFGPGWHSPERDPDPFRWTSAANSSIRVSVAPAGPIHVTITATPAARPAQQPVIALAVNACTFPPRPMPPGQADYEWDVPANCWRAGANQVWTSVTPLVSPASLNGGPDTRLLGARVGAVRLRRLADQNAK